MTHIDASGAVRGRLSQPDNYAGPAKSKQKNRGLSTPAPRARRQHLLCSSTPPATSQRPKTVGDPSNHSVSVGVAYKFYMIDAFKSV